jgi:two-component system sensor histidine kinase KdpD
VVAAYDVCDHPRNALAGLQVLNASRQLPHQKKLDVEAVLARNPDVVCIDDLVSLDTQGRPAFECLPKLLAAGITVLGTVHVMSVRSAATAVAEMLGESVREPVLDDEVLELIDELEIVDIPNAALIERIKERGILSPAELALGMQRELRPDVLAVLRETGLRIIAEHADRQLATYLPATPLEFRRRLVLCLPIRPGLEDRIRSAGKYAKAQDAKFTVATVKNRGLSEEEKQMLGSYAALAHQQGGQFVRLEGRKVAATLAQYIQETQATEVVIGHRPRARWRPWDTTGQLIRRLYGVDVHILRAGTLNGDTRK